MFRTNWRNTVHQQFQNWILLGWSIFVWLSSMYGHLIACMHTQQISFCGGAVPAPVFMADRDLAYEVFGTVHQVLDGALSFECLPTFTDWQAVPEGLHHTYLRERERERLLTQIDRHAPRSYFQRCRFRHSIETLQSIVPYQVFVSVFVFLMILNIFHNDQWWCCRTIRSSLYLMLSKRKLPCEDIKVTFSVLTVDRKKPKLKGPHHSPKIWG